MYGVFSCHFRPNGFKCYTEDSLSIVPIDRVVYSTLLDAGRLLAKINQPYLGLANRPRPAVENDESRNGIIAGLIANLRLHYRHRGQAEKIRRLAEDDQMVC